MGRLWRDWVWADCEGVRRACEGVWRTGTVHTRTQDEAVAKEFGFEYAPLDEVLQAADVVCLFAALTHETRHMIGARELSLMKPSAFW